jgi:hypothetical protein
MRLWSLHPELLDAKGLVALWREALLAKHVLEGKTKGYKNHPQLKRFKEAIRPLDAINQFLSEVFAEALRRNYHFDKEKINTGFTKQTLMVTRGQLEYEMKHLLKKLERRDSEKHKEVTSRKSIAVHPLFEVREGEVEEWEIVD